MAEFLVELYVSRADPDAVGRERERAGAACAELTSEGRPARLLRSLFLPDEEMCFFLFEADSAEIVREAASRAELVVEHVAETITSDATVRTST
jgi:muconolactone delta-isomerase